MGSGINMSLPLPMNRAINSPTKRHAPVPDSVCTAATRPDWSTSAPSPYANTSECFTNGATPAMPAYSWSGFFASSFARAARTDGKTHGFPVSSLYAPTPRFTFVGDGFFANSSFNPRILSAGASGIWAQVLMHEVRVRSPALRIVDVIRCIVLTPCFRPQIHA